MKRPRLLLVLAATAGLAAVAGCQREDTDPTEGAEAPAGEPLYEANKGVRLPPELRRDLGVVTEELTERAVARQAVRPVQIFRPGGPGGPAAGLAWLDPAEARGLAPGQAVAVTDPGPPPLTVSGTLTALHTASAMPGRVEVEIALPDAPGRWPVGRLLQAAFALGATNTVPVVPASAVVDSASGPFVYAENDGHYVRTPVRLGATDNGYVEITGGLYAGDAVVVQGAEALWTIELCALKGGTPCCPVPLKKDKAADRD
ncbi:MAG: hypothetical protein RJA22_2859 [Verrucomicrobiota bacterium]|jgi:hypothetical protein